ncbi:MAG TPA: metallophosphoesterase [Lentisphaeria bacterium]|nr:MAG: hypothetical protein A2X45_15930 [Lentisphaerae bacterium GWF2_50_93]HCE46394.1 metallophosphoesterase [Lentisphaeria bacterium]
MKYAIISDIHGNLEALSVVLEKCKAEGVEKYICLGDIVGYNANPRECLQMIRSLDLIGCVKGNHDEYVSNNDEEMLGFNQHAKQAVLWTKAQLNDEERDWLSKLPMKQTVRGTNITIVHATLDSPASWGYIFDVHHAMDNFSYQFTPLCFCGHSHVPIAFCKKSFTGSNSLLVEEIQEWKAEVAEGVPAKNDNDPLINIQKGWKYLINIGSVGQPRNRDPRASFAIYDAETNTITRLRLAYDIPSAQKKIKEAGLPERLALRLERGN